MPADAATEVANVIASFAPFFIIGIIIGVVILVIVKWKGKKEEDEMQRPTIIEPEEKFIDQHKNLLKNFGTRVDFRSWLKFGPVQTSRVMRFMPIYLPKGDMKLKNIKKKSDLQEVRDILDGKAESDNHYILETLPPGIINRIMYMFGYRMNFMIIPMGLVNTENSSNWNLPYDASITPFFDRIYYLDTPGKKYMHEYHDELTLKQVLKNQVNYIPQMQYHDFLTGKYAAKSREHYAGKHRAWKQREEDLEKEPEDEGDEKE